LLEGIIGYLAQIKAFLLPRLSGVNPTSQSMLSVYGELAWGDYLPKIGFTT